jgi:hypothetical protein
MRWLRRLQHAGTDREASESARLKALRATLEEMVPGAPGLPPGSSPRVAAARERADRVRDPAAAARAVRAALRPVG